MSGHTPGPWYTLRCGANAANRWNVFANLPTQEGRPQSIRTIDQVLDYCGAEEAEANARLIAAAPEMLEALEWLHAGKGKPVDVAAIIAKARGAS